jgi:myo-inositol 2-dehydrogenase/D-chiro-inositol 1-dehydrogenase
VAGAPPDLETSPAVLGVGMLGAGPVTQAIHLPTIATMADRLRVVHVMDVDEDVARAVAGRVDARHTIDEAALLADPEVDVVAICSPHQFHAAQVEAAAAAGKKAILCEKPLAVDRDQLARIVTASHRSGVPVIVGAMHVHDPGFGAAAEAWKDRARLVRSMISLPPNPRYMDNATELRNPPPAGGGASDEAMMEGLILGLATHAIPLVRRFASALDELVTARVVPPGYELTLRSGDCVVQYLAHFSRHWRPDWHLEVWGEQQELRADFPPSFVLAGSAAATLRGPAGDRSWWVPENAYQAEWRHIADVAEGAPPRVPVEEAAADLGYGLDLLEGALERMRGAG